MAEHLFLRPFLKGSLVMSTQMLIWVMVLVCVAIVMIVKTFSGSRETAPSDGHIFDGETGQRVNNWKYTTEDDGE